MHDSATRRERTMPPVVQPGPGSSRRKAVVAGARPATPDRMSARAASIVHSESTEERIREVRHPACPGTVESRYGTP